MKCLGLAVADLEAEHNELEGERDRLEGERDEAREQRDELEAALRGQAVAE